MLMNNRDFSKISDQTGVSEKLLSEMWVSYPYDMASLSLSLLRAQRKLPPCNMDDWLIALKERCQELSAAEIANFCFDIFGRNFRHVYVWLRDKDSRHFIE